MKFTNLSNAFFVLNNFYFFQISDVNNSRTLTTSKNTKTGTKQSTTNLDLTQPTAKQHKTRMASKQISQKQMKVQSQSTTMTTTTIKTRSTVHTRNGNKKAILENDNNESISSENFGENSINKDEKMDVNDDDVVESDGGGSATKASNHSHECDIKNDSDDDENNDKDDESCETPAPKKRKLRTNSTEIDLPNRSSFVETFIRVNPSILNRNFVKDLHLKWLEADENSADDSDTISSKQSTHSKKPTEYSIKQESSSSSSGSSSSQSNGSDIDIAKLYSSPFKICVMQSFLENKFYVKQLVQEMCQMEWQRKQIDLYEFHQTTDLANLSYCSSPALKSFYQALNDVMLPWMKQITGLPLTHVSASCSMYNFGDFLLVHDDLLSDRQIAFVYYLSPWPGAEHWTEEMGGALELFECDPSNGQPKYPIVQKIPPCNNQFTFFRVCSKSFHQVGEVTNVVYPRLTINGWFHGPIIKNGDITSSSTTSSALENSSIVAQSHSAYVPPVTNDIDLNEWVNAVYLQQQAKLSIQEHIEDKSEASLEMFLIREFYELLVNEFKENGDLQWELQGPANQRKYETLRLDLQSTGPTKDLYELFTSKSMFTLLHQYTELDFDGPYVKTPTCSVQICRFTQGCYTLLGDSSTFAESALDVILFFNVKNQVGTVTYLSPDCIGESMVTDPDATTSSEWSGNGLSHTSSDATNAMASSYIIAGTSRTQRAAIVPKNTINRRRLYSTRKPKSNSSATTFASSTSEEETGAEESSISLEEAEPIDAVNQDTTAGGASLSSEAGEAMSDSSEEEVEDMDDDDDIEDEEEDEDENDEDNYDDLARENVLLSVHPKYNALNLVYRLSGQTKFVKYVSKNCIDANEYVYILFATFKE